MRRANKDLHVTDANQRALLNGVDQNFVLECWFIPSKPFINNTAYTLRKGLVGYYLQTRFLDEVEEKNNVPTEAYRNSLNAIFDGTTLWNIQNKGIEFLFAADITIQNSRIVGYGSPESVIGIDANHWHNSDDWFFTNNDVEGFNNENIGFSPPLNADVTIEGGTFNNSWTDIEIRETNFDIDVSEEDEDKTGILNRTMTLSNLTFQNTNRNIVMNPLFTLNQEAQDGIDFPDEEKNVFYFLMNDDITLNYGPFQNVKLYFNQQASDFIPITNSNYQLEVPPGDPSTDVIIPSQYRNKTNAQLQSLTSNPSTSFGGELIPNTAEMHPTIIGGMVDGNISTNTAELLMEENSISLYPNPTPGDLILKVESGDYSVKILDINGILHEQLNINGDHTIDINQMPEGLYFIEIKNVNNNNLYLHKILKQ